MSITTLKWNKKALEEFEKAIAYIEEYLIANGILFKEAILNKIDGVLPNPERYPPDKYKLNNDGSFRAFELHSYRISYRIKPYEIRIIRVRHTKMNPLHY